MDDDFKLAGKGLAGEVNERVEVLMGKLSGSPRCGEAVHRRITHT
ncbi:MAG: hypothetical protein ACYCZA_01765 [Thiobacillus sp.]